MTKSNTTASSTGSTTDTLVRMTLVARQFGYADAIHFCKNVAAGKGITPVRQGGRWFAWHSEFDRAFAALPAPAASASTAPVAGKATT